jgi:chemotaxis protein methyltransferase CheR
VTPREFAELSDLVRRYAGLVLTPDKKSLARNRLKPVAQRFGFRDTAALLAELAYPPEELARAIVEVLLTNETSFFRDRAAFDFLAQSAIPTLLKNRGPSERIRIWCAATSSGQEAYSFAILLDGLVALDRQIDLIATDLSEAAIARAKAGLYSQFEVDRGLTPDLLAHYFVQDNEQWRACDPIRRQVKFRTFNLLDHFGWLGRIDIILCRNVLFYLEPAEKAKIYEKLAGTLADDGYLVLGENERALGPFDSSEVARGVFVKQRTTQRRPYRLVG